MSGLTASDAVEVGKHLNAELILIGNELWLRNKSEVNRTQLNKTELATNRKFKLSSGDVIAMGELELKYTI